MVINLHKGDKVSLEKNGSSLRNVYLGLGWDAASEKKRGLFSRLSGGGSSIDLDASAIMFDAHGHAVDLVFYGHTTSRDGSIIHNGDNLTGEGDGDDEGIHVNLQAIPQGVQSIVFVITSYSGHTFNQVENAFCRVVDESTREEVVRYTLNEQGNRTAKVVATIARTPGGWEFKAVGELADGKTPQQVQQYASNFA